MALGFSRVRLGLLALLLNNSTGLIRKPLPVLEHIARLAEELELGLGLGIVHAACLAEE